ncbi:hypothetical protein ACIGB8_10575 [Promicromonospora sukumoe]|uniref:hypothetical protein n=1 Tax=Promicromonospora sukumoe TaxID=88382 RepID=UPI0037C61CDA
MTAAGRVVEYIVDTNFLLCFGGVKNGLPYLKTIFGGGLAAPPAVKAELRSLSTRLSKPKSVRDAADRFLGTSAGIIMEMRLKSVDLIERDEVLRCFGAGVTPTPHSGTFPDDLGDDVEEVTSGKDAGEAEAIPLALRTKLPLLCNENAATNYARARGVPLVESAAVSVKRLKALSAKQKYRLYLEMRNAVGDVGAFVNGPQWYREPSPRVVAPGSTAEHPSGEATSSATEEGARS